MLTHKLLKKGQDDDTYNITHLPFIHQVIFFGITSRSIQHHIKIYEVFCLLLLLFYFLCHANNKHTKKKKGKRETSISSSCSELSSCLVLIWMGNTQTDREVVRERSAEKIEVSDFPIELFTSSWLNCLPARSFPFRGKFLEKVERN